MIINLLAFIGIVFIMLVIVALVYEPHNARNNPNPYPRPDIPPSENNILSNTNKEKTVSMLAYGLIDEGKDINIEIHRDGTYIINVINK